MSTDRPAPHEDESLPPQLREALRIMSKRGRVVELTGRSVIDGLSAQPATPPAEDAERQERYAITLHDAVEEDLTLNDQDLPVQALYARMAEAAMALADNEQRGDLPAWEAVYEPGNVSDYLIGYANDQDAATGMAEAWMRSQAEVTGRLEWVPWGTVTPMPSGYDRWFELVERHDDGVDTGPGIVVRRRLADAPAADRTAEPDAEGEGDELVCVDQCGCCDACGMEPFGTPAEGWREAARFLRRTARASGHRLGALHAATMIEAELRRLAEDRAAEATDPIVAYRNSSRPGTLLCREHGDGWAWLTPLTSDDLPDGGTCTYGDPADPDDVCGRDVLIEQPAEQP